MSWRERHLRAIHELEAAAAAVMLGALDRILDDVQGQFAAVTAAAHEPEPGEPAASLDDLAKIQTQWIAAVDGTIVPWFREVFEAGGMGAVEQVAEVTGREVPDVRPDLMDEAAARHLATSRNRILSVGEETWTRTRASLLEGFQAGEGIDPLRRRVQEAADLSRSTAEAVARTEVISAANGGSLARVRLMGADAPPYKQWLATMDARTRPTHAAADNQVVGHGERFQVGAAGLDYPGDPSGPPDEVIQCRCTVLFLDDPEPLEALGRQEGGITEEVAPLVAAAQEVAAMPWEVRRGGDDCPFEVVQTDTDERVACHDTEQEAVDQVAALYANEPDADEAQARPGEHWHSVMHTQGVSTGMRTFHDLTWRKPPFALHWQRSSSAHGGMPETVQVGLVDRVVAVGDALHAWGRLDLDGEMGREFGRQLVAGFARWVSIGLDEQPVDMEILWPEGHDDDDPMGALFAEPEQVIMTGGRIGELTAVSMPAQDDATVEPTAELVELMQRPKEEAAMVLTAAVTGSTDLPVAARDHDWDGEGARQRVFELCSDGDSVDVDCVSRAFLWRDQDADPETMGAWSLGFADVVNGELQIVPRGVAAAAGGRGVDAADIPDAEKARIRTRICSLYDRVRNEHDDWPECPFGQGDASVADVVQHLTAAAYRIEIPELPPAWWFEEPSDVEITSALSVTEEGRIYGALAPLGVGHRAFARSGRRQEVPCGNVDYARFMGGSALTSSGPIPAGPITMDCGHASRYRADHDVASDHYENACSVVGKIRVGESKDRGVVWVAGALEPGVSVDEVSRMLACRLSGDWQPHPDKHGWQELVAALLVPSPGFPMPNQASTRFEEGVLVASSVPVRTTEATGRPRLRIDLGARRVERVASATPREKIRAVISRVKGA